VVHVEHGTYYDSNGLLQSSSTHVDCDTRCQNPTWNGTIPDFSKYMTDGGKLVETAIRKDTILVPAGGYVIVAVPLNNPGYWLLHCHSEPHLFKGMAVVLQEYPENQHPKPPYGINKVGHFIGGQDQQAPVVETNRWKIGAIVVLILVGIALVVIVVQGVVIARIKSSVWSRCSVLHKHVRESVVKYSVFNEQSESNSEELDDNIHS
jgi:cytochrome b subunit of formate dehydrogenase